MSNQYCLCLDYPEGLFLVQDLAFLVSTYFFLLMTDSNNFWSVYSLRRSATTKESRNNQSGTTGLSTKFTILLFNKFCNFYYGMCQQHRSYQPLHWLTAMYSVLWLMQTQLNSPSITFNFQNKLHFQSEEQCRQHALYSHKARYNKPIRIPVRMVHQKFKNLQSSPSKIVR